MTIPKSKPLAIALAGFFILVVLTWTHRALSFPVLVPETIGDGLAAIMRPFFVGAMSDLWVAYLLSILTWIIAVIAGKTGAYVWLGILALLTAAHQAYVEFFHFQIVPAHLVYLTDLDFLSANAQSAFSLRGLLILAAFGVMVWAQNKVEFTTMLSTGKRAGIAFAALLPLCLWAHHENIMLRDQWFIPECLRAQALENLMIRWESFTPPVRLSADEVAELASAVGAKDSRPWALLSRKPQTDDALPQALKQAFEASRAAGKKPVVATVLMESLRPSETGYFAPARPSLTPRLDALQAGGLVFKQTYSTGSVTRGGQEAVLCGYLGSRDASLMRGHSLARIRCIPDELAQKEPKGGFFWYHGGEGRYDGQQRFWSDRQTRDALSQKDFPVDAPHSGWGVGDQTFFKRAYEKLAALRRDPRYDFLAGLFLSVSNHIPWELPGDAPPEIAAERNNAAHPSYVTTRYADDALGKFVDQAKKDGLWDDMMLLILSDHGNDVPPYTELYPEKKTRRVHLQSHVNFVVAGGLVEKALKSLARTPPVVDETVRSQADAAALAAYVIGLDTSFMGEVPFGPRSLPVIAELEENLWVPAADAAVTRQEAASGVIHGEEPPSMRTARLYYRLFLDFIARN
jgi:hypothetical protein